MTGSKNCPEIQKGLLKGLTAYLTNSEYSIVVVGGGRFTSRTTKGMSVGQSVRGSLLVWSVELLDVGLIDAEVEEVVMRGAGEGGIDMRQRGMLCARLDQRNVLKSQWFIVSV